MPNSKTNRLSLSNVLAAYFEDLQNAGIDDYIRPPLAESNIVSLISNDDSSSSDESSSTISQEIKGVALPPSRSQSNSRPEPIVSSTIIPELSNPSDPENRFARLARLAEEVARCQRCPALAAHRTQTVFGVGNPYSELVFIGEGPGAEEDKQGVPFVGRSGQLLTDVITKGMKLRREDVYICNIVRCRPPENRNPTNDEAECCRPFLNATLEIIQPKFICCLGSIAATNLLDTDQKIGRLRGTVHDYRGAKVVCTYHPAYLLRNPPAKSLTWEDVKLLMRTMNLPVS